jgi:tight adherence protein B
MTALRNLLESAGFGERRSEVLVLVSGTSLLGGLLTFFTTQIAGLAFCFSALTLVIWLEVLRAVSASRQKRMDFLWPTVFDALRSGSQAGLSMLEQIEYLASDGPEVFREQFAALASELERGVDTQAALAGFQRRVGSRSGDSLAIVMALVEEVGGRGEAANWDQAAKDLRQEQSVISQVRAKQGWVLGSAKIALLAPWIICLLLLNLEQNRAAFSDPEGSLVLVLGLILSLFAYFLTNLLGKLKLPERVFYVG